MAEVNNTPWREQHCYVLWAGNRTGQTARLRYSHEKAFHVSPFMDMNATYEWQLGVPGKKLFVQVANSREGERFFAATMVLSRRTLDRRNLKYLLLRYPMMTARIMAAIYYQAGRLWWKKCPFHPHPKQQVSAGAN